MSSSQGWQVDLLEVAQKCVYCGYCSLCPTFKELKWENYHPRGILDQIKLYYSERIKDNLKNDVSKSLFDAIFACTMCKACENICIVDLPLLKVWEQVKLKIRSGFPLSPTGLAGMTSGEGKIYRPKKACVCPQVC